MSTLTTPPLSPMFPQAGPWSPYTDAQNKVIAAAWHKDRNGSVLLPGTRFEVRFGTSATSAKVKHASTGILQVNLDSQNSRDVRYLGGSMAAEVVGGRATAAGSSASPASPATGASTPVTINDTW